MPLRRNPPLHKFITKPAPVIRPAIVYRPHQSLQHPPIPRLGGYEILAQETFTILPKTAFIAILKFGVRIRRGIVFVSLKQNMKVQRLSLQDGVVFEAVDDIIITLQNNSDVPVTINAGEGICIVGRQID